MEQWIYENHTWYYHYNFTTKKKDAGEISLGACTFFAEVSHKQGQDALEVNCCCKMEDEDNGWCYDCKNNGSHGMRHPKNSDAYTGGHLDVFLPFDSEEPSSSDDEDAKETRLRNVSEV
ncbi:hypothetical protein BDA96_10G028800 [Sorghum bicolor]|uniref:DUF3615 domain-containing protein n=2 Tax=Sorghum bicolor TaxID=4558 RepID=A0A1W0VR53_SORBI|nr:hypothetical protein BDA96_10G028800 [Sorghum bicolor]OQU75757.1 hypothetical protein SORBI_3010G024700 [Sorghum bicolor]OQU75758.1 hypothetical protein SORBI_3010G024700 [Sorghum bicolor]